MKKPNWQTVNRLEDGPITYHQLVNTLQTWLEFGRDSEGQCHKGIFGPGGAHYVVLERHLKEIQRNHQVQQHSNLTQRLKR